MKEDHTEKYQQLGFKNEQEFREFLERKLDYLVHEGIVGVNEHGKYYQKTDEELNQEVDNIN